MVAFHNMPRQSTPFIGRVRELTEIARLLADPACRLVSLVGPGGIGKTRLAVQAGFHQIAHFAHGVYFVALATVNSADLLGPAVASALTLTIYGPEDLDKQIHTFLRDKQILLVMDNFEHLLAGTGLVSALLEADPDLKILITSRERLNLSEEWVLTLGGLAYPVDPSPDPIGNYSAVQLFVQRARQLQADFSVADNEQAIVAICQYLEGLPLGLELAASWLRVMPCRQIAAQIQRSLDLLITPLRDVPERHRSIRVVFEHSWTLLSDAERDVVAGLSVFRSGFDIEAAEQVAGASLPLLASLADKSLIRLNPTGRYEMHELLRQYAEDKQGSSPQSSENIHNRHAAYYAEFLRQRWDPLRTDQQPAILDEIAMDIDNVRAAWRYMVSQGQLADISKSESSLWYYHDLRDRNQEGLELFGQAVELLEVTVAGTERDLVLGHLLARQAWFYTSVGFPGTGKALIEKSLAFLRRPENQPEHVIALDSLCMTSFFLEEFSAMQQAAQEGLQVARDSGDLWWEGRCLHWLGLSYLLQHEYDEARRWAQASLEIAQECGDFWLRAVVSAAVLGEVAYVLGDYVEAKRRYQQSLGWFEQIGMPWGIGKTYRDLGRIAVATNELAEAGHYLRQSLEVHQSIGQTWEITVTLVVVADLSMAQDKKEQAVELLTLICCHPKTSKAARAEAEQRLDDLEANLPPGVFKAVCERGTALKLETVIDEFPEKPGAAQSQRSRDQALAESLSERELEVLRLIADGLSNAEIAQTLYLTVGTVKVHTHNIFTKLGASSRTQAVAQAQKLGLM